MDIKRGTPVSPGVAIGPALVLDTEWFRIPQRFVEGDNATEEVDRLAQALRSAAGEARADQQTVSDKLGGQYGAILGAHAMLIEDPFLAEEVATLIREQGMAAE